MAPRTQQQIHQYRERRETLPIAKKLNKFIALPNSNSWKVHDSDVLARGQVLTFLRTKYTFWPDSLSALKMRQCTVTRHGFLVIYENPVKGLIVDLRNAEVVKTNSDRFKGKRSTYNRCHIKVRMNRGNIHIFIRDDDVSKWTSAIIRAHTNQRQKPIASAAVESRQGVVAPVSPVTAVEERVQDNDQIAEEDTVISERSDSSNSGIVTVIENPTIQQIPSIRRGNLSVRSIRRRLEKKLVMKPASQVEKLSPIEEEKEPQTYVSSIFVFNGQVQQEIDEEAEEMVEVPEMTEQISKKSSNNSASEKSQKREWWTRSLRC